MDRNKEIYPSVGSEDHLVKSTVHYTPESLVTVGDLAKLRGLDRGTAEKYVAEMEADGLKHPKVNGTHRRYLFGDVQAHLEAIKQSA